MSHCTCPKDGAYYCAWCLARASRAGFHVMPHYDAGAAEAPLQARLREAALGAGYLFYHTHSSKRSDPGWPDTVIVHPDDPAPTLFLWELKRQDQSAQPSPAQRRWLDALARVTRVHVGLYRPSDWEAMVTLLRRSPPDAPEA